MKVRISEQSLRMRLAEVDLERLCSEETISVQLQLDAVDSFKIELRAWHLEISEIHRSNKTLVVSIPLTAVQHMLHEKGFAYRCEQEVHGAKALLLEVEIDLQKSSHS